MTAAAEFAESAVQRMRAAAASADARRAAVWDAMDDCRRAAVLRVACLDQTMAAMRWADLPADAVEDVQMAIRAMVEIVRGMSFRVPACG